jgi:hypothetical protein
MPRFVILEHDWPTTHWDFLLEAGAVLRAWRLLEEPELGKEVPAEANFDHRLVYLDFEGPLSGNRGSVRRWDAGTFEWIEDGAERVVVELKGAKLTGQATLARKASGVVFNLGEDGLTQRRKDAERKE